MVESDAAKAIFRLLHVACQRSRTVQWMPADHDPERFEIIRVADGLLEAQVLIHDDGHLELVELGE